MAIIIERQINDDEKNQILQRFGRKCYATGHDILNDEDIQYDHIKAFADKGASELDNIAPMCRKHNLQKGRLPLEDFRTKLKIEEFFERGSALTLKDELQYFKDKGEVTSFGETTHYEVDNNTITVELDNKKQNYQLYKLDFTSILDEAEKHLTANFNFDKREKYIANEFRFRRPHPTDKFKTIGTHLIFINLRIA